MPQLTLDEAAAFLDRHYRGRAQRVEALGAGYWSAAYSFELDGRELVPRFGHWREDFEMDRLATSFDRPELPVPDVLEIGDFEDGCYAISQRKHGRFLETLSASDSNWAGPMLWRALDALRSVEVPETTDSRRLDGFSGGSWRDYLATPKDEPGGRVSGWQDRMNEEPDIAELFLRTDREVQHFVSSGNCPEIRHILHLDLINRNVLVDETSQQITAVFDWGCLAVGDFLYELACLDFWTPWYPLLGALDLQQQSVRHFEQIRMDVPCFDERFRCYQLHVGLVHLAYCTFAGLTNDLHDVAKRTAQVLGESA